MKQEKNNEFACRLGTVGGQAVMEGVMMKSKKACSIAVRTVKGKIDVKKVPFSSLGEKHAFFRIPIIRGVVNFFEMLKFSMTTLTTSADMIGLIEEEEETKFEKWLKKTFGKSMMDVIMVIAMVLGLALGVGLFVVLPTWIGGLIPKAETKVGFLDGFLRSLLEGGIRIGIFMLYLWLVSFMKDIRRTFEYHGAEHKSIFCYESGEELTPENVKKYKRFHPRCGTSFMFVMLFLSILIFALIPTEFSFVPAAANTWLRVGIRVLLVPIVVGIGYEFIRFAGKHDNWLVRALSAPGLWMQRLTTKEPDEQQIEVAIAALKSALPDVFPDFKVENGAAEGDADNAAEASDDDAAEASETPEDEKDADGAINESAGEAPTEAAEAAEEVTSAEIAPVEEGLTDTDQA